MAESTGKQTPSTDPKADEKPADKAPGKTGPVRPPVLEGTARPTPGSKPADSAAAAGTNKPDKPSASATPPKTPAPETTSSAGTAWLAGIAGGVLGLGAAYALAWYGLWPSPQPEVPPADPRIAQFATAIPELETITGTVQDELSTLTGRVGALETSVADVPQTGIDPEAFASAEALSALSARLDDLAAVAGTDTGATATSESLAAIEAELAELRAGNAQASADLAEARQQIAMLTQSADENAGSNQAAARLPLIFSALESAFDAGRPFEAELAALRQALPDTIVPEAIAARAADGLPLPDAVQRGFAATLPDMLAGRPATADASWQDAGIDWFRGLVAMRPAGAVEGTGPDAVVARLEAAIAARDFTTAQSELTALPEAMQAAAGPVADDIARLAAARAFLDQLRQQALTGESGA